MTPLCKAAGRGVIWLLTLLTLGGVVSCDKDDGADFESGEVKQYEVAGLRAVIERRAIAADGHLLVMGRSGPRLQARLIWTDAEGNVLLDHVAAGIERPIDSAACIREDTAQLVWVTETDGGTAIYRHQLSGTTLEGEDAAPIVTSEGALTVQPVSGDRPCLLCFHDSQTGRLACQPEEPNRETQSWHVGPLGHWEVLRTSDELVLADWAADDEGWITARMTPLRDTDPADVGWLHSYLLAQLPDTSDPVTLDLSRPHFSATEGGVVAVFVDGTDWFTRLFLQKFALDEALPGRPHLLESCRGTCKVRWADRYEGALWIWYEDEVGDWACRYDDAGNLERQRFTPPPNVEPLSGGWFKLGLGSEVVNWWGLVQHERG